eukprot:TRINITY_DN2718_c0_g1_i1.p1 TRINITY_DN2718_c0_g1~~TRINITY_DN2718_c0_g1_i1.p1  ORF type:complete len:834 (-),score=202.33 TRINITY_DN2718_c0_g1_i1:85-2586(-)
MASSSEKTVSALCTPHQKETDLGGSSFLYDYHFRPESFHNCARPQLGCALQVPNSDASFVDFYGNKHKATVRCVKPPNLRQTTKEELVAYFQNTYALYDTLFYALKSEEVYYMIPDRLRRPLIFYYGHTSVLYVNKMSLAKLISPEERPNPHFEKLLETGVDEMSWDDMDNDKFNWPSVREVSAYRKEVHDLILRVINRQEINGPITWEHPLWSLVMGTEHDHIHLETSSVLFRQLPVSVVQKPPLWTYAPMNLSTPVNELVQVPKGKVTLGKPKEFPFFGWDNEYGHEEKTVEAFRGTKFLISNKEFLGFVEAGGYSIRKYWVSEEGDDEAWRWCTFRNAKHPSFWVATDEMRCTCGKPDWPYQKDCSKGIAGPKGYKYRAMFDIIDMPWDWPAEVNYHEAKAYCRWKSSIDGVEYRMPTEVEYHRMRANGPRDGYELDPEHAGDREDIIFREQLPGNISMQWGSSTPVNFYSPTKAGFYDIYGNVWEWVEDHFHAFEGFEIHHLYDDFSTPCFDSFHTIILGGSWISCGQEASVFARYHFRRHFFQHVGFRMVVNEQATKQAAADIKREKKENDQVLLSNYGDLSTFQPNASISGGAVWQSIQPFFSLPAGVVNVRAQVAQAIVSSFGASVPSSLRAIELGCQAGRTSFELARHFQRVVGVENNKEFFRLSMILKRHGKREYKRLEEGDITVDALALLPKEIDRSRVCFENREYHECSVLGQFDVVIVNDILDKVKNPEVLTTAKNLVAAGGKLVIVSGYDWNEATVPKNNWVGGFRLNGEDMGTEALLKKEMSKEYDCGETLNIPLVHRITQRKYELSLVSLLLFSKKSA